MDIWSWIIVSLIALIAILAVIDNLTRQNKDSDKFKPLYALIYQTNEYIRFVSAFNDHIGKIERQLPQINEQELSKIYVSLLRKSSALAAVTYLRANKTFDLIKNNSLNNIAMSKEDTEMIDVILKEAYGNDYDNFDIDLSDDSLDSIRKIIEAETNKNI